MGAVAVPYLAVAKVPALQWVRMPSPCFKRLNPISPMFRLMATSSSRMAWASVKRISLIWATSLSKLARMTRSMRFKAQNKFTAVGREEARYSFCSMNFSQNFCGSAVSMPEAVRAMA